MQSPDLALVALSNRDYKRVVATTQRTQATVMAIPANASIGSEIHADHDQLVSVVDGSGAVIVDGTRTVVGPGSVVLVPGGARHDVQNISARTILRLVVLYMPPKYAPGAVYATAADMESV